MAGAHDGRGLRGVDAVWEDEVGGFEGRRAVVELVAGGFQLVELRGNTVFEDSEALTGPLAKLVWRACYVDVSGGDQVIDDVAQLRW